ncbi:MAG: NADH:ubiquinone oxidoreductase subunit NDUFA12 [Proteobacteria bacterium]|nr:NADH:ubiquinone oxidoreductase subunit NDUFA12 [Pseudomonadota bacterium]
MATLGTLLYTWFRGEFVGKDAFGNRYYRVKARKGPRIERRWVIYKGEPEASTVPPEWHAWLHHTADEPLDARLVAAKPWQKAHQPNVSGTGAAYRPPGHDLEGGRRARATGDYEPWRPA